MSAYSYPFPPGPIDSISSIAVNGSLNNETTALASGSWDNTVTCYEVKYSQPTSAMFSSSSTAISASLIPERLRHEAPVLAVDLDGMTSYSGGCDTKLRSWNISQPASSAQVVGQHDNAIRCVKRACVGPSDVVITGSWDKTIRCWDPRVPSGSSSGGAAGGSTSGGATITTQLSERVYCMDVKDTAMVVATADRLVHIFDLRAGVAKISEFMSPMKFQPMCVSVFADLMGFTLGAVDGRVAVEYFSEVSRKNHNGTYSSGGAGPNFSFKCHREPLGAAQDGCDVYAVNAIEFRHNNTFATFGSDGRVMFWDKDHRVKLGTQDMMKGRCPITCGKYSPNGKHVFFAASYDWSKGANPQACERMTNTIYAQELTEGQTKKRTT